MTAIFTRATNEIWITVQIQVLLRGIFKKLYRDLNPTYNLVAVNTLALTTIDLIYQSALIQQKHTFLAHQRNKRTSDHASIASQFTTGFCPKNSRRNSINLQEN
jgi:hypothetical protein